MTYITVMQSPRYQQMSFDDLMDDDLDMSGYVNHMTTNTRTYAAERLNEKKLERYDFPGMIGMLRDFNNACAQLFDMDRMSLYESFKIPKRSGGLRPIDAPKPPLMDALRKLKFILEYNFNALYHTSAFAYIRGRCTVDSLKRHQQRESRWFVKLDFSNFFGSTTLDFVMSQLSMIFPFSEIVKSEEGKEQLTRAMSLCFLNGGLPQGTPISPLLTNLIMIPIDHQISNRLRDFNKQQFVYTRYADDIMISCKYDFIFQDVYKMVVETVERFNAPYKLNPGKTRYGSSAGSNWNLGLMLNKDNEITIGHRKKKQFKAMIHNFARDFSNGVKWQKTDVQVLNGLICYYKMVEKDYIEYILSNYSRQFKLNIRQVIKASLKAAG